MTDYVGVIWALVGALTLLILAAIVVMVKKHRQYVHENPFRSTAEADLLKEQLLRGEISSAEYERRVRDIEKRDQAA